MHRCLDEDVLIRLAAGLLSVPEASRLLANVEECPACSAVLIEAGTALSHSQTTHAEFQVGDVIARRYEVQRFIGRGGMGEVFEVIDTELQERVALKIIRSEFSDDADVVLRFKQELRLARRVIHPNVCRVFDLGVASTVEGTELYFHTMEFISGRPLSSFRGVDRVPLSVAVPVLQQLALGLAAIHSMGIVHRDLKPENIMLCSEEGNAPRVVVLDFGIARSRDKLAGLVTTGPGVRMGTPDYMAPELLTFTSVSTASDVFSFGLVVYELLVGRHPCPDSGSRAALSALGELNIAPLTNYRSDLPPGLNELVARCLAADPAQRPPTGAALATELLRLGLS